MWWQPDLAPLPGNGVTTVVGGNCGFALAPAREDPAVRDEVIKIFSFFEDFPEGPFRSHLPWDWRTWSEYKASVEKNVRIPIHYAADVGHIALRLAAMGMDAWERAARPDEIARMTSVPSAERLARLAEGLPVRLQWAGVPTFQWHKDLGIQQPLTAIHERFAAEGRDYWTGFMHVPITTVASIEHSLLFAQSNDGEGARATPGIMRPSRSRFSRRRRGRSSLAERGTMSRPS